MTLIGQASLAFSYAAATSASIALDIMFLMVLAKHEMIPFALGVCIGVVRGENTLSLRKNSPPARLFALGSDRYDATLETHRTMSLALYLIVAFGFAAQ